MFIEIFMKDGSAIPGGSLEEMITDLLALTIVLLILNSALKSLDNTNSAKPFWHFSIPRKTIQQTPLFVGFYLGLLMTIQYYRL